MAKEKMQVRVTRGIHALFNIVEISGHALLSERSIDQTTDLRYIILEPMLMIRLREWVKLTSEPRTCTQDWLCPFFKKCSTTCWKIFPNLHAICPCIVYDIEDVLSVAKKIVRYNNSVYKLNSIYKLSDFTKNFKGG
jgi:hypothetical protein